MNFFGDTIGGLVKLVNSWREQHYKSTHERKVLSSKYDNRHHEMIDGELLVFSPMLSSKEINRSTVMDFF